MKLFELPSARKITTERRTRLPFELTDNYQVYCWLRMKLEPRFQVVAIPAASYFSESLYCYQVLDGNRRVREFHGDFRDLQPLQLVNEARAFVESLSTVKLTAVSADATDAVAISPVAPIAHPPTISSPIVASRLIPLRTDVTYFSSGRAAFSFLIGEVVRPRRVWLPTFVCWSLISAMQQRFPQTPLMFYTVDRHLSCQWPNTAEPGDAIVFIHFFGHLSKSPQTVAGCTRLEDVSHVLIPPASWSGDFAFGSLRKLFRIADGGQIHGRWNPCYETDDGLTVWLRAASRDWRDLREAENMMDRNWKISDMSSQSMAQMMTSNVTQAAEQRRKNQQFLHRHFPVGDPLVRFRPDEVPLLQNIVLTEKDARDSLRAFLASRGIFCSIHWPLHPLLRQQSDVFNCTDAAWLEDHVLSIPVADDFDEFRMEAICNAAAEWKRAGA